METYDKGTYEKSMDLNVERVPGGKITHAIEVQTGKLPWVSWLGLSALSMVASAALVSTRKENRDYASFVGLWAPCFMLMGVYAKLVQIDKALGVHAGENPSSRAGVPSATAYLS